MDILSYVLDEGLVMVPVLFIIGEIIKRTEIVDNKWIPLFLMVFSIAFTPFFMGEFSAQNIVQAILVAGATVFSNELIKQGQKE